MNINKRLIKMGTALLLTVPAIATATTISTLTESEFNNLIPGSELVVETFESSATGSYSTPVGFSNFQYDVSASSAYIGTGYELGVGLNNTLSALDTTSTRTFEFTSADLVTSFGTDMQMSAFGSGPQTFNVTATGNSGTALFQFDRTSTDAFEWLFTGFYDPLGLISIEFTNLGYNSGTGTGYSNYKFDNVKTLTTIAVPAPPTIYLLFVGMLALVPLRKASRGSYLDMQN